MLKAISARADREPLVITGLNFKGQRNRFTSKTGIHYFLDGNGAMYRDGVSDFVVELNQKSGGAVVRRLERVYTHVFVDEVQHLVGFVASRPLIWISCLEEISGVISSVG